MTISQTRNHFSLPWKVKLFSQSPTNDLIFRKSMLTTDILWGWYTVAFPPLPSPWFSRGCSRSCCCCLLAQSVQLFATTWAAVPEASLSLTISQSLPKFMFIALVMLSSHLILWHPLLFLPLIFPSIRDFPNESSVRIRWPNCWSFSFSISPFSDYSGLISLKTDWFDLLAFQGTFRSLFQHHSSTASVLCCSAFLAVQLSQLYVTPD